MRSFERKADLFGLTVSEVDMILDVGAYYIEILSLRFDS
jgi:hypothetical protein